MASKNLLKSLFLLVVTLISIGLLTFCLVSDWWLKVNEAKLKATQNEFERAYLAFNQQNPSVLGKADIQVKSQLDSKLEELPKQVLDDGSSIDSYGYDDDYYLYDDSNSKQISRNKRSPMDFVYIKKKWPLVKLKSLFSECIEYKEFYMRISIAYLTINIEPIIGEIHYGKYLLNEQENDSFKCQNGQIKCLLTQQCVDGKKCNGIVECPDQSDEQQCDSQVNCSPSDHKCDNRCWNSWHKCDGKPHCSDMSDEINCATEDSSSMYAFFSRMLGKSNSTTDTDDSISKAPAVSEPFTFGQYHFNQKHQCFMHYFNFKSAEKVNKDTLQYLSSTLADNLQEAHNIKYHIHLIYTLSFLAALIFSILSLLSLLFVVCFKKVCFQCPYWFYGFFNILAWLSSSFGLITFLYECFSNHQHVLDPLARVPIDNELIRLNVEVAQLQQFGISFWFAVATTSMSFFASFVSCIICCRLPTARHEDKEYKIMQLPTYS